MFCSSLRRQTRLDGYDVSFTLPPQDKSRPGGSFKVLLLSSEEAKTATAKARIERLSMLDGGKNVAIILLMEKGGCVDSLVGLQMSIMAHGISSMPIIPTSSASELVSRLDALRRQFANAANISISRADEEAARAEQLRDLVSRCVHGQPLPREHVDVVTDLSAGLASLARLVFSADGQRRIRDLLGDAQGGRLIAFFTHGYESSRRLGVWSRDAALNDGAAQSVGREAMLQ
ncbi:hypothetical protein CCMA1212_002250 [Trichoderma ghanense]|uniref:Uncharacterized protein n=1 Tax=Trichoderma ghanense TaxID=65468 RepID=A0ABY2HBJ9_9HYPO